MPGLPFVSAGPRSRVAWSFIFTQGRGVCSNSEHLKFLCALSAGQQICPSGKPLLVEREHRPQLREPKWRCAWPAVCGSAEMQVMGFLCGNSHF